MAQREEDTHICIGLSPLGSSDFSLVLCLFLHVSCSLLLSLLLLFLLDPLDISPPHVLRWPGAGASPHRFAFERNFSFERVHDHSGVGVDNGIGSSAGGILMTAKWQVG